MKESKISQFILSNEIIHLIIMHFKDSPKDLLSFSLVNREFFMVSSYDDIWKDILFQSYPFSKIHIESRFKFVYSQLRQKKPTKRKGSVNELKLAVVGTGGVGKTNFVVRYIQNIFLDEYVKKLVLIIGPNNRRHL